LGIATLEDWYNITKQRFDKNYGSGLLDFYNGSLILAITGCFPDYNWQVEKFYYKRTNQKRIFNIVKEIWADAKWEFKHPDLRYKHSDMKMELDMWIPSIKLAIEYQGEQHFFPIKHWGGEAAFIETQRRDKEKRDTCNARGINLLEIPYTWDGKKSSLVEQIQLVLATCMR